MHGVVGAAAHQLHRVVRHDRNQGSQQSVQRLRAGAQAAVAACRSRSAGRRHGTAGAAERAQRQQREGHALVLCAEAQQPRGGVRQQLAQPLRLRLGLHAVRQGGGAGCCCRALRRLCGVQQRQIPCIEAATGQLVAHFVYQLLQRPWGDWRTAAGGARWRPHQRRQHPHQRVRQPQQRRCSRPHQR